MSISNDPNLYPNLDSLAGFVGEERTVWMNVNDIAGAVGRGGHQLHDPEGVRSVLSGFSRYNPLPSAALDQIRKPADQIGQPLNILTIDAPKDEVTKRIAIRDGLSPEAIKKAEDTRREMIHQHLINEAAVENAKDLGSKASGGVSKVSGRAVGVRGALSTAVSAGAGAMRPLSGAMRAASTTTKVVATLTGTVGLGSMMASAIQYVVAAASVVVGTTAAPIVVGAAVVVGAVGLAFLARRFL